MPKEMALETFSPKALPINIASGHRIIMAPRMRKKIFLMFCFLKAWNKAIKLESGIISL